MSKTAAFFQNKYYSDAGMDYVFERLREEFCKRKVELIRVTDIYASYPMNETNFDFGIFWDKDTTLASRLESTGLRLFNRSDAIALCDDKEKTFSALGGKLELPLTIASPLVYDVSNGKDERLISLIESKIGYPAVVKENVGSQGRQVYLAHDKAELAAIHEKLAHIPHLFQRFVKGEKTGSDTRVYVVGKKAVGAVLRENTTDFRSNAALGGKMTRAELTDELREKAEIAARALNLEYGSADFICENGKFVFIEANSSAYMKNAESLGIPIGALFSEYVLEETNESVR